MSIDDIDLNSPISSLFMVGPIYAKKLQKLGVVTISDFLYHFPFRYDDFSNIKTIKDIRIGDTATISGEILEIKNVFTKNGKRLTMAKIGDNVGIIDAVWFNQIYLVKSLKKGTRANFSGKIGFFGRLIVLESPDYEIIKNSDDQTIHTGRLVPVYPETSGLSSKWIRSRMFPLLKSVSSQIDDFLPSEIINKYEYPELSKALIAIHFPKNDLEMKFSRDRLSFDELFLLSLASKKKKLDHDKVAISKAFTIDDKEIEKFITSLPFELTSSQKKVTDEILGDLKLGRPMNRLLEGDVGSGKTVVAAIAMLVAFLNSGKSALMAPTEILANQHYTTLKNLLSPFGLKIALRTSSTKIDNDSYDVIVGTHALLQKDFIFDNLAFAVIDEQHRFGVEQRSLLWQKGKNTHVLTMTATPIPRTVALTIYGELDLSVIDEMPKGRKKIKTWLVPNNKRQNAYTWIKTTIENTKCQVFLVCPFIEESETLQSVKAVKNEYETLRKNVFPNLRLDLLHGRMKTKDKEAILNSFRLGKTDILVTTPIVEVGIDIPNAAIMVIEGADRFGLAQLHQLRGRIGRGEKESFCLLFTENENVNVIKRLKCLETNFVGPVLAELDLKMRGPGEIYGIKQTGHDSLKIASLFDEELIIKAQNEAISLLKADPDLNKFPLLNKALKRLKIDNVATN